MFQRRIQQMKLRFDELLYRWKSDSSIRVHGAHMAPIQVCRLEERILMSATPVAAVAAEAASLNELTDAPADNAGESHVSTENSTQETADSTSDNSSAMSTTQTREIVLVDTGAHDYQQLVNDIVNNTDESRGFELFLFDSNRDGIEQITELLSNYRDVDAMHIVSHGTDGRVKLGNTWLSSNNFRAHGGTIAAWGQSLSSDADLLFYGCDLASNEDGRELLRSIAAVCDCDVVASDDLTGHASLGGDWDLEYATGVVDTSVAFGIEVQETWAGLLAVETLRDEFNSVSYSNNHGSVAWANDWQEIGESNGVSAGNVQIWTAFGEQGLQIWQSGKGAMREADLSAATSATLTFDYARFGLDDPGDYIVIEVSANGGGSWFELDRFQGPANDVALQSASYDISTYIASNTQIRFVSSGMNATESLFVDNVQIEYDDTVAPGGVDTNLNLWLRADADVTLAAGSKVTEWDNQVSTSPLTDVSASGGNRPTLNASALNFNPVISFDGSNDKLSASAVLGSTLFSSNASSIYTVTSLDDSGNVILQWRNDDPTGNANRVSIEDQLRFDYGHLTADKYETPHIDGYHIVNAVASPSTPVSQFFNIDGKQTTPADASGDNPLDVGNPGTFTLGDYYIGGYAENMDLGEVIIFGSDLSAADQAQVDSYLAVKYGITLDQTAATNYVDSQGNVIWNATTNSIWNNDIAGIGRDLTSTLDQSQSRSISVDAIVTMSAASDQHNREFLIWGNDDAALTETAAGNPVGVAQRLERIWRVDESGDVGTTTITFDVNSLPITGTTAADFTLIVDTDTDFSTDVTLVGASGFAGGIVTFSGVNLADAQYFALGTDAATGSPVGPVGDTNAAADSVAENASVGATVGVTALASDPDGVDTVTYTLDNDAGGLFDIALNSGIVTVAAALDYESATSHDIVVRATSTDTSSTTQLFTINVINVNEGHTGAATITGTPTEDQVLTAGNTLADPDGMGTVAYQWQRNGSDVTGETGLTYTLTDTDVGQMIRVVAGYTDGGGFLESEISAAVGAIGGVNDQPTATIVPIAFGVDEDDPLILLPGLSVADIDDGGFDLDVTLSVTDGILNLGNTTGLIFSGGGNDTATMTVTGTKAALNAALATVSYRPDPDFNGTDMLTLNVDDRGNTGSGGAKSDNDTANIFVDPVNDPPVGLPTMSGTVQEGFVLTANTGGISDNDGLGSFTYQWLRNGGTIAGATSSTYTLVAADVGTQISVRVDYTDLQSTAESVTSGQTAPVSPAANNLPVGVPTIVGTTTEDQVLTADTSGISDADGLGAFSYQWLRDAVAIGGATSSTHTLGDADVGTNISVQVSYTDGGANSESVTSAQTSPIANVNDVPTITAISDQIIGEEGSTGPLAFAVGDIETPTGLLTVTASSSDVVRIPDSNIALTNLGGGNWTVEVTGALDQDGGPTTVTVTVGDGTTTVAETFNVLIDPVNDAPKLNPVPVQSVNEAAAVGASVVTVPATDTDAGDTLTFTMIGGNTNSDFAIAADGTITINNPLDYAITSVYHLVVQVTDSGTPALTDTVTVTIEVTAPVTAPPAPVTPDDSGDDEAEEEVVETPDPVADSPEDPAAPPTPAAPHSEAAAPQEELPVILAVDNTVVAEEQLVFQETIIRTALDEVPEANELRGGLTASSVDRTMTDAVASPAYNHFELARDLQQMREDLEQPAAQQFFSAATAMGTSGSLTVGYVLWALRSGWLASSVLAQMPAWRLIDPLVVLSSLDGTEVDGEDDSLQAMLKARAREHADSTDSDPES